MGLSIPGFGKFWKIKMEIFGWGPEKMVFTFSMEKHLSITRNIRISLKQHNKKSNEPLTKVLLRCACSIVGFVAAIHCSELRLAQ
jgi:hypothetical protein